MKKTMIQITTIVVMLSLICSCCMLMTCATDQTLQYEDLTDLYSDEMSFFDDKIIVILDNISSVTFKSFDTELQKIIECSSINDLTAFKTQKIKAHIENQSNFIQSNDAANVANDIELEKYNKILCLNLKTPSKEKVLNAIEKLNKLDGVLCAFPDFEISIDSSMNNSNSRQIESTPNDIYDLLSLNQAWQSVSNLTPNKVRVAVIDTGIDKNHPALVGKIDESTSARMIGYKGEEYDDFDDYVGVEHIDDNGHGTHVAGIIAASIDTETGMRGVCTSVELISIKVLNDLGKGRFSDLVAGMAYVASLDDTSDKIDIVNISAGIADYYYQEILQSSLTSFVSDYDGLVVCSAGNENANLTGSDRFPASIEGDNIITVGASDADDTRWISSNTSGSNYGGPVDIFAPGVDIVSCIASGSLGLSCPGDNCTSDVHIADGYHALTGTSMAAPFVTGVAALMLSVNSNLTAEDIKSVITDEKYVDYSTSSRDPINELYMICDSGGRLNAYKAVSAVLPCMHSNIYYTYTSSTHTRRCSDCSAVLSISNHSLTRTSLGNNSHRIRCTVCAYSVTEAHQPYLYEVNGTNGTVIKCHGCSFVLTCSHEALYAPSGAAGHQVGCPNGCFLMFEEHTLQDMGEYDDDIHTVECIYCGYTESAEHELYMYEDNGEDGCTVNCRDCDYSLYCPEAPEFDDRGLSGHYASCPGGCFGFFEDHTYEYTSQDSIYHYATCIHCMYYVSEIPHEWVDDGSRFICSDCGRIINYSSPNGIANLTVEELAVLVTLLPEDKLEMLIASIPDADLARVTALLPRDDGELLTE